MSEKICKITVRCDEETYKEMRKIAYEQNSKYGDILKELLGARKLLIGNTIEESEIAK